MEKKPMNRHQKIVKAADLLLEAKSLLLEARRDAYDPDQPRDEQGRFGSTGAGHNKTTEREKAGAKPLKSGDIVKVKGRPARVVTTPDSDPSTHVWVTFTDTTGPKDEDAHVARHEIEHTGKNANTEVEERNKAAKAGESETHWPSGAAKGEGEESDPNDDPDYRRALEEAPKPKFGQPKIATKESLAFDPHAGDRARVQSWNEEMRNKAKVERSKLKAKSKKKDAFDPDQPRDKDGKFAGDGSGGGGGKAPKKAKAPKNPKIEAAKAEHQRLFKISEAEPTGANLAAAAIAYSRYRATVKSEKAVAAAAKTQASVTEKVAEKAAEKPPADQAQRSGSRGSSAHSERIMKNAEARAKLLADGEGGEDDEGLDEEDRQIERSKQSPEYQRYAAEERARNEREAETARKMKEIKERGRARRAEAEKQMAEHYSLENSRKAIQEREAKEGTLTPDEGNEYLEHEAQLRSLTRGIYRFSAIREGGVGPKVLGFEVETDPRTEAAVGHTGKTRKEAYMKAIAHIKSKPPRKK